MRFGKASLVFIPFLAVLLMSHNTFADTVQVSSPTIYWRAYSVNGGLTSQAFNSTSALPRVILAYTPGQYRTLQGFTIDFDVQDTLQTRFKTLVTKARVTQTDAEGVSGTDPHKSLANPISWVTAGTTVQGVTGGKCSTQWLDKYNLEYTCTVNLDEYKTITNAQVTLGWAPTNTIHSDPLAVLCGTDISPNCAGNVLLSRFSYELSGKDSPTDANVEKIYSEVQVTNELLEEMNQREQEGIDNISGQSESDIQGAENQVTTNLIGIISSFVSELSNFSPTDCNLDLPLPSFIGGNTTVNICQGKDVLGNFITLFSTLTVLLFYLPLAWVLLKMIYNEIRSWTNG